MFRTPVAAAMLASSVSAFLQIVALLPLFTYINNRQMLNYAYTMALILLILVFVPTFISLSSPALVTHKPNALLKTTIGATAITVLFWLRSLASSIFLGYFWDGWFGSVGFDLLHGALVGYCSFRLFGIRRTGHACACGIIAILPYLAQNSAYKLTLVQDLISERVEVSALFQIAQDLTYIFSFVYPAWKVEQYLILLRSENSPVSSS